MSFSGDLDLGPLGSYSGSPFLTPDAFLRSPDKDGLGEFVLGNYILLLHFLFIYALIAVYTSGVI